MVLAHGGPVRRQREPFELFAGDVVDPRSIGYAPVPRVVRSLRARLALPVGRSRAWWRFRPRTAMPALASTVNTWIIGSMLARFPDPDAREIAWLEARGGSQWVLGAFQALVLVLNPFWSRKGPVRWDEISEHAVDGSLPTGDHRPNPNSLMDQASRRGESITRPSIGCTDHTIRRMLARELLTSTEATSGTIGFYLSVGELPGDAQIERPVRLARNVEFAFASADLYAVLREWSTRWYRVGSDLTGWTEFVAFLWPTNKSWLLEVDPDSSYTAISCDRILAHRLAAMPQLECLVYDPSPERPTDSSEM